MTDSDAHDALLAKRARNREHRRAQIIRWAEYVRSTEPSVWGSQQNRLVDSQLASARASAIDDDVRRRIEEAEFSSEER